MNFHEYFQQLWFTNKESEIFLALYKLWTKPASTIAKYVNLERTYVYKVLINMVNKWIVLTSEKNWIKQFFIPDLSILKNYISNQKEKINNIEKNYPIIENPTFQRLRFMTDLNESEIFIMIFMKLRRKNDIL